MSTSRSVTLSLPTELLNQIEAFIQTQKPNSLDEFVTLALRDKLVKTNSNVISKSSLVQQEVNPEEDSIWLLGTDTVEDTITDASINLDYYLYNQG
ncbi:MAG: hypothetical protein ACRC6M_07540 [Microcystaceae cyanobacterium]